MSIDPLMLGIAGCVLLVALCVVGVRIAFAAAVVNRWSAALRACWS